MKMEKRPEPIEPAQLSTMRMGSGGNGKLLVVIDEGMIKRYVGIGWVTERRARTADYTKYPEVKRDGR